MLGSPGTTVSGSTSVATPAVAVTEPALALVPARKFTWIWPEDVVAETGTVPAIAENDTEVPSATSLPNWSFTMAVTAALPRTGTIVGCTLSVIVAAGPGVKVSVTTPWAAPAPAVASEVPVLLEAA